MHLNVPCTLRIWNIWPVMPPKTSDSFEKLWSNSWLLQGADLTQRMILETDLINYSRPKQVFTVSSSQGRRFLLAGDSDVHAAKGPEQQAFVSNDFMLTDRVSWDHGLMWCRNQGCCLGIEQLVPSWLCTKTSLVPPRQASNLSTPLKWIP